AQPRGEEELIAPAHLLLGVRADGRVRRVNLRGRELRGRGGHRLHAGGRKSLSAKEAGVELLSVELSSDGRGGAQRARDLLRRRGAVVHRDERETAQRL